MNWGNKLLLVFVVFGCMIGYMVYRCVQIPVDLVNKEYYRDELVYQKVIDGSNKANALSGKLRLQQLPGMISLQLPEEMKATAVKGTIVFYCPSDVARDRHLPLQVDAGARQEISTRDILPGSYTVKVSWESAGVQYFVEQALTVTASRKDNYSK